MNLHLKSKMHIINTHHGYFLCGGTHEKGKYSNNQCFMYHPLASVEKSTSALSLMPEGRFDSGITYVK
jgi:hypothetical protein